MDEALRNSQRKKEFLIDDVAYPRIPCGYETGAFGDDILDPDDATCVRCYAPSGFYHLLGCGLEQCPICNEGALGCRCQYVIPTMGQSEGDTGIGNHH